MTAARRAAPLTARERTILQLVAEGWRDHESAERLGLSYETVRTHVRNVRDKLNARNRPHAVAVGIASGQIRLPRPGGSEIDLGSA